MCHDASCKFCQEGLPLLSGFFPATGQAVPAPVTAAVMQATLKELGVVGRAEEQVTPTHAWDCAAVLYEGGECDCVPQLQYEGADKPALNPKRKVEYLQLRKFDAMAYLNAKEQQR